jgi:hypothetical protein
MKIGFDRVAIEAVETGYLCGIPDITGAVLCNAIDQSV